MPATTQVYAITDRCGSYHLFYRRQGLRTLLSTSSAVLAQCGPAVFDPVGLHEFVATGVIYEDRTLWSDVRKVPGGCVLTIAGNGDLQSEPYWSFADVPAETLTLDEADSALRNALGSVLNALSTAEYPLVSDLTGGYDSRLLLSALLASKQPFTTTVTGQADDPDVRVAADIAQRFGLKLEVIQPLRELPPDLLMRALHMTDGECDMFEYANILHTQSSHVAGHAASLNGSFGELARGYWWELLWPKLGRMQVLDANMLSRRRFAALPYEAGLFAGAADFKLDKHLGEVVTRTLKPIQHQPNTTQMDCAYYSLRMQRWQGRIASSTNRLWPSFSPVGFAQVLDPILAAKAATRFRSLLARKVISHNVKLGKIPLEHGYPPCPAKPWNIWRFAPLLGHYGGKVVEKLKQRLPSRGQQTVPITQGERPEFAALFAHTEVATYLTQPRLLESGFFKEAELKAFLSPSRQLNSHRNLQWRRLVTLEFLLRRMASD